MRKKCKKHFPHALYVLTDLFIHHHACICFYARGKNRERNATWGIYPICAAESKRKHITLQQQQQSNNEYCNRKQVRPPVHQAEEERGEKILWGGGGGQPSEARNMDSQVNWGKYKSICICIKKTVKSPEPQFGAGDRAPRCDRYPAPGGERHGSRQRGIRRAGCACWFTV